MKHYALVISKSNKLKAAVLSKMSKTKKLVFFIISTFLLSLVVFIRLAMVRHRVYEPDISKRIAYTKDPVLSDKLCREDVKKAKRDVEKGKIVLTQRYGFGTMPYRFEEELAELCKSHDITFEVVLISDLIIHGQTQGCNADYMDGILSERFGTEFKEKLLERADSLFLKNAMLYDSLVDSRYCDERPYLTNIAHKKDDYNFSLTVDDVPIKKDTVSGNWPHLDVEIIIEKDSSIGNFHVSYYADLANNNEQYKQALFKRSSDYLKTIHPIWIPGKIAGHPVRTSHNVRIFFLPE